MGKIIDTTNVIDSSMLLKAKLPKNMVKDNYYLDAIQEKINREWTYRYNVVDIGEEEISGSEIFNPIEVVIQTAYDTYQKTVMGDDWKRLVFKDIKHPVNEGKRYKFCVDFEKIDIPEIEKSIWLTVNTNKTSPTRGILVRRCDSFFTIPSSDKKEIHYEPVALESDFKYINFYSDTTITVPQAEMYAVMQYNQYTKYIKINHRFLVGPVNLYDREDNMIFKVKAVRKFQSGATYDLNSIDLVVLALERSLVDAQDDFETRIVSQNASYNVDDIIKIPEENIENNDIPELEYYIKIDSSSDNRILLNSQGDFSCYIYDSNNNIVDGEITIQVDLLSTTNDSYYYEYQRHDNNHFSIFNKKAYMKNKLQVMCTATIKNKDISCEILIELGGNT
jgi:hypothetical protein